MERPMSVFEDRQSLAQGRTGVAVEVPQRRLHGGDRFPDAVARVRAGIGWQELRRLADMHTDIGDGRLCTAHDFGRLGAVGEWDEALGDETVGASLRLE